MTDNVIGLGEYRPPTPSRKVDMRSAFGWLDMPSPVLTASGCAASGRELDQFFDITDLGAVITKSVMMQPRAGRPTPRMCETPSGMLNSIGLQGPGIDTFIEEDLAWLEARGVRTVVSIAGESIEEYGKLAQKLRNASGVDGIEVNISCPNVSSPGHFFADDPMAAANVVSTVRRQCDSNTPVYVKLSPDVTDITEVAMAVVKAGANGVTLINTARGLVIDVDTMLPALAGITGGLSGPAIRPIALRCVWQVRAAVPEIPILGVGGIATGLDALQFILAGASAVSVGSMTFNDPTAPIRVQEELEVALGERGFASVADAVSYGHRADRRLGADSVAGLLRR